MEENNDINQNNFKTNLIKENVNEDKENMEILTIETNDNNDKNIIISNKETIDTNMNKNQNKENENQTQINDYIITIQYSKFLCIPYFYFSNILYFYFPCKSFISNQIKLSELPTPPFAVIRSERKLL